MFEVSNGALQLFTRGIESNTKILYALKVGEGFKEVGTSVAGNKERAATAVVEVGKGAEA